MRLSCGVRYTPDCLLARGGTGCKRLAVGHTGPFCPRGPGCRGGAPRPCRWPRSLPGRLHGPRECGAGRLSHLSHESDTSGEAGFAVCHPGLFGGKALPSQPCGRVMHPLPGVRLFTEVGVLPPTSQSALLGEELKLSPGLRRSAAAWVGGGVRTTSVSLS